MKLRYFSANTVICPASRPACQQHILAAPEHAMNTCIDAAFAIAEIQQTSNFQQEKSATRIFPYVVEKPALHSELIR
jgi:hypothetical protein